jgi:hypothetical protein
MQVAVISLQAAATTLDDPFAVVAGVAGLLVV